MIARIEIADKSFNLLEVLDREVMNLSWDYSRIGGCGSFSFDLPRQFCNEKFISGDFNIKIKRRNPSTDAYDLWYQGLVEEKIPTIKASNELISVRGHGYQAQLSRIYLNDVTYSATELSAIVSDIINTYVAPNTDITAGTISSTGFTATLTFNTDALSAIQTCADIAGTREWGVDRNRQFNFQPRSSTVGYNYPLGGKVLSFSSDDSFKDIINRIIIQGGDVGGVPFTATYNSLASQAKYGRRDKVIQNSSVTTSDVASQLATAYFAEFSDVVRKGSCEILDETLIETTLPIPLFQIFAPAVTYGEKNYGVFLYSGRISYQINRINYKINNQGDLTIMLNIGQLRPNVSENIKQIQYELEQLRSASL